MMIEGLVARLPLVPGSRSLRVAGQADTAREVRRYIWRSGDTYWMGRRAELGFEEAREPREGF